MNLLNRILPYFSSITTPDWTVHKDVKYGVSDSEVADLYLLNKGVHPAVVFIHGGGWSAGDKSAYEGRARRYALAGFNVIAINYRLATEDVSTHWSAQLNDCQLAMRWIRRNADAFLIHPNRIGVGGDSAGAHLALMLGTDFHYDTNDRAALYHSYSSKPDCILDMFGPIDLTDTKMSKLVGDLPLFGHTPYAENPQMYKEASPRFYITPKFPPTCIFHGFKDEVVPWYQSSYLNYLLNQNGVTNEFHLFDGGHELGKLGWYDQMDIEMTGLAFMRRQLKP